MNAAFWSMIGLLTVAMTAFWLGHWCGKHDERDAQEARERTK